MTSKLDFVLAHSKIEDPLTRNEKSEDEVHFYLGARLMLTF